MQKLVHNWHKYVGSYDNEPAIDYHVVDLIGHGHHVVMETALQREGNMRNPSHRPQDSS